MPRLCTGLLERSCQTNSAPGSLPFLGITKRTVLSNLWQSTQLARHVGFVFTDSVRFLTSTTRGRKRLIDARQVRRWATANSSGSTLRPNTNTTQKKKKSTYHGANKFVSRAKKNGKSICPLGGWFKSFSFWSQVKRSAVWLTAQLPDETLLQGNLLLHPDSTKMWHNREMSYVLSFLRSDPSTHTSRSWLLTAWSAQWFFPLVHFRVNFPPINVWFPGPYCVLLLPYHADEFSLSVSLCAKWKRSADFTPGKKRGKNPRRKSLTARCDPV